MKSFKTKHQYSLSDTIVRGNITEAFVVADSLVQGNVQGSLVREIPIQIQRTMNAPISPEMMSLPSTKKDIAFTYMLHIKNINAPS